MQYAVVDPKAALHAVAKYEDRLYLQEIMNRVLGAERVSEAQLVEARTKAKVQKIEAQAKADAQRLQAQTDAEVVLLNVRSTADAARLSVHAEMESLQEREKLAGAYTTHPALLRIEELTTLRLLGETPTPDYTLTSRRSRNTTATTSELVSGGAKPYSAWVHSGKYVAMSLHSLGSRQ